MTTEELLVETPAFEGFPKMARLNRECLISEKLDGTNAQLLIGEDGSMVIGSRTRWITPDNDNMGFAKWATARQEELVAGLGPGRHFGEWWGQGIQRNYGLKEKRFSLFNTGRWHVTGDAPRLVSAPYAPVEKWTQEAPSCCGVVPVLYQGLFNSAMIGGVLGNLREDGSVAAPGFMKPEGIIVYHVAAGVGFKVTLDGDALPKSLAGGK